MWPWSACSPSPEPSAPRATALVVTYRTRRLDLSWLPDDAPAIVVHNDSSLSSGLASEPRVRHVRAERNLGFGAAVNLAALLADSERLVLVNPDVTLTAEHWAALVGADERDVATVPLVDERGCPTSVVSRYLGATALLLSGYRVGRLAPRGGRRRAAASRLLGRWGDTHRDSLRSVTGAWPLRERWVSGAVLSVDTERFRALGGFDERFFLYYEDVDLCRRLAAADGDMRAVVCSTPPAVHRVGGSAEGSTLRDSSAERARLASAITYARGMRGPRWRACEHALAARTWFGGVGS